jgi:hypothetical protein
MSQCHFFSKTVLFSAILLSGIQSAHAFPRGCEVSGFGYNQNYLLLNDTGKQSYYLVQNRSDTKIELEHQSADDSFMNPPLHATFEPSSWGAFASDIQNLDFKCYRRLDEENTTLIDCRDVLDICQYPRVRFALSNMGNYWISFNKSQNEVIQESVAKGIYLKW